MGVEGDNTSLVRLGNVGEDDIDKGKEHSVFVRVARILDDS
jgi:hypothetical protein